MGGVDLCSTSTSVTTATIASQNVGGFVSFFHMFDLCIVNAYILYKHVYRMNFHPQMKFKPKDQMKFRMRVIDQLVNHYTRRKVTGPVFTPFVSLVPAGYKIDDLRPNGISPGRCEYYSVGPFRKKHLRKETQLDVLNARRDCAQLDVG